jgi:hypothetical protein
MRETTRNRHARKAGTRALPEPQYGLRFVTNSCGCFQLGCQCAQRYKILN